MERKHEGTTEKGDTVRTLIIKGSTGPYGRLSDGRTILFNSVPDDFAYGKIAEVLLTRVEDTYASGSVVKVHDIPNEPVTRAEYAQAITAPAPVKHVEEEGWHSVRVRLAASAKSYCFMIPQAIAHQFKEGHRKTFELRFRQVEP